MYYCEGIRMEAGITASALGWQDPVAGLALNAMTLDIMCRCMAFLMNVSENMEMRTPGGIAQRSLTSSLSR